VTLRLAGPTRTVCNLNSVSTVTVLVLVTVTVTGAAAAGRVLMFNTSAATTAAGPAAVVFAYRRHSKSSEFVNSESRVSGRKRMTRTVTRASRGQTWPPRQSGGT
jgi:hypothetical protein